jgi:hypothetical protein
MTSTLLKTPWQVDHLGQCSGPWEGKQTVFKSARGNGRRLNDESVSWGQWCSKKDNQMNKQTQIILGAMLVKDNPSSNWWAALHLKDIFISSSWFIISNMVTTFERRYRIVTFEWSWKDAPIKTDCGTICFETQRCTSPHEYGWWTSLIMPNHFFV